MSAATCNTGVQPADELVKFPWGLERNAARALIASGELRARKIGRCWYARRSDVLALITNAPKPAKASGASIPQDLAAIAERTRNGGGK